MASEKPSWLTYAVVGTTAGVAVAGIAYLAYNFFSAEDDDEASSSQEDAESAARLRVARGIQMQALAPKRTPPAPPAAKPAAKPAPSATVKTLVGSKGKKTCAQCDKPCNGLPLRCSGCKQVYYCSQDCQKAAWPTHKTACKPTASSASSSKGGASSQGGAAEAAESSTTPAPAVAAEKEGVEKEGTAESASTSGANADEPKSFQEALARYLEETAASKTDPLESMFETAVMLFVKAEFRAAITQLHRVQDLARERGNVSVEGEGFKWLGHAHNKLSEPSKAEEFFTAGAAFAEKHDIPRLQIDCLSGLGCMHRAQNEHTKAVAQLQKALALCDVTKDEDSRASTLCNLGAALVQTNSEQALLYLHEAVDIRERAIERLHDAGERNGLATAVMEHASAMVNLASALFVTKRHEQAKMCYERALEVFEMVEDVEKVAKVLVNLANMTELQMKGGEARKEAAGFRTKLVNFLEGHGVRRLDTQCAICLEPMAMKEPTKSDDQELIMLACMHCLHNKCWDKWLTTNSHEGTATCPTCKQPVPLYSSDM